MSAQRNYWAECISDAAAECDLTITADQLAYLAEAVEGSHDNYGLAFYSPPAADGVRAEARILAEQNAATVKRLEGQLSNMEKAVRMALKLPDHAIIDVDKYGYVEARIR